MTQHPLTIEIRPDARSVTLALSGELDLASADTLRVCLGQLEGGYEEVVVDLAALQFIDSTGLNLLVHTHQSLAEDEPPRRLTLRNPQGHVRRVFEVSGVDQVIPLAGASA